MSTPALAPDGAVRVVVCDYNALLLSVTGLLRMSGYYVFQAYDGNAALELCQTLPEVSLLILNTDGTGVDSPTLVRAIRERRPHLQALHVGNSLLAGMPEDVPTVHEAFTSSELLEAVSGLVGRWAALEGREVPPPA